MARGTENSGPDEGTKIQLAVMGEKLESIEKMTQEIKDRMEADYVTADRFDALCSRVQFLERIVFGMLTLVLVSVGGALIKLVVFP